MLAIIYFNPRSHERSDKGGNGGVADGKNFNPRSHERSDAAAQVPTIKR